VAKENRCSDYSSGRGWKAAQTSAGEANADAVEAPVPAAEVVALARGEPQAVQAFCRELLEPVYAFVHWRVDGVRQDAEDVTQETLMTALASIDRFEGALLERAQRCRPVPRSPCGRRAGDRVVLYGIVSLIRTGR
jgi:hypothetical protein